VADTVNLAAVTRTRDAGTMWRIASPTPHEESAQWALSFFSLVANDHRFFQQSFEPVSAYRMQRFDENLFAVLGCLYHRFDLAGAAWRIIEERKMEGALSVASTFVENARQLKQVLKRDLRMLAAYLLRSGAAQHHNGCRGPNSARQQSWNPTNTRNIAAAIKRAE